MNISFVLLFIIIVLHVKPTDGNKNQIKSKTCTPYLLQTDGIFLFSNKSWEDSDINKNYRELRNQRYHINWLTGKKEEF